MSRELYSNNLLRSYATRDIDYQKPSKEKPSAYKLSLLNNSFPITLTDGEFIYDIVINDTCDIIFKGLIGGDVYYNDVPSTLKKSMIKSDCCKSPIAEESVCTKCKNPCKRHPVLTIDQLRVLESGDVKRGPELNKPEEIE